jgi:hypothetical protein
MVDFRLGIQGQTPFLYTPLGILFPNRPISLASESHTETFLRSEGLTDGHVSKGCLSGEDAVAGGTLDLLDVLRPSEAA